MHISEIPNEIKGIIRTVPSVNFVYQEWRESHLETDAPDGTFDEKQWIQFCQRAMVVMDREIDTLTQVLTQELSRRPATVVGTVKAKRIEKGSSVTAVKLGNIGGK